MTDQWLSSLTDWYAYRRQPWTPEVADPSTDTELVPLSGSSKRVDSGISISDLTLISKEPTNNLISDSRSEEPIHLKLNFGDRIYTKLLEYGSFSRWSAMEELKTSLERDGIGVKALWDEVEIIEVCGGDWDARARPGWSLQLDCQSLGPYHKRDSLEYDSDSGDIGSVEERWVDEVLDRYEEEWCLPRWRDRVEQGMSTTKKTHDPSWRVLALGCVSMILFIVVVVVYTI